MTFAVKLKAQDSEIDSLKNALKIAKQDTTRVKLLSELSEVCELIDILTYSEPCVILCQKVLSLSPSSKIKRTYLTYLAKGYNNIGFFYDTQGDINKAMDNYFKSLNIYEKIENKKGVALCLNNIGTIYDNQGDIPKALDYYHKSLKIMEDINDKQSVSKCLNNIGFIYRNQGDLSKALEYYKKSLKICEETNNKAGVAYALNNIGVIFGTQGEMDKALVYYQQSLKIKEEIKDQQGVAYSLNSIGMIYQNKNDLPVALDYYNKSLKIRGNIKDKKGITISLNNVAAVMLLQGNIQKALKYGNLSLVTAKQMGYPENIKKAAGTIKNIYQKQNKFKEALEMYELEIQMRDSINNQETKKASVKKQFQYQYEKKAAADSVKNSEEQKVKNAQLTAQNAQLKQEKTQRFALYGGLALMLVFAGFMFNRFKITQRQKNIITLQKVKVDEAYEELNQQNEEIAAQRDEIEKQKYKVEEHQKEIIDSITYAKRLQEAILPSKDFVTEYLPENFILYKPKDLVAGDFYWAENVGNKFLIAAADSTGHGVPGAMVSVVCSNALNRSLKEFGLTEPGLLLDKTRELVLETFSKSSSDVKDGMDISLLSIEYSINQNTKDSVQHTTIKWSGANNPLWYLLPGATELSEIKANKQPIGKTDNPSPFTTHTISLPCGEGRGGATFYLFTDGYADQFGGDKGKKFKYKQLEELLIANVNLGLNQQSEILNSKFENWKGDLEQVDDVCIIGIRL